MFFARAHTHTHTHAHAHTHTHTHTHASALGSAKMTDESKQQYKSMWLAIPDQARIALLILSALGLNKILFIHHNHKLNK